MFCGISLSRGIEGKCGIQGCLILKGAKINLYLRVMWRFSSKMEITSLFLSRFATAVGRETINRSTHDERMWRVECFRSFDFQEKKFLVIKNR